MSAAKPTADLFGDWHRRFVVWFALVAFVGAAAMEWSVAVRCGVFATLLNYTPPRAVAVWGVFSVVWAIADHLLFISRWMP